MRVVRNVWGSLLLTLLAISSPAAGQVRPPRAAAPPKWSELEKTVGSEDYAQAKEQAEAIIQRGAPEDRQKTMAVYGRILLALGQKDQARQYLAMLSKSGGGEQLAIYNAWLAALDKPEEGIKALEAMLEKAGGAPSEADAEAADVLAMLYMARGEQEKAKKAVDFGLKALEYRGVKSGYILALLRGRLTSDIAAGEAKRLYNQAEKLRAEKKFIEAGQLFAQVRAAYPQNQWGHASGFRIGQCYAGLNRPAQAIDWWQKFIKELPAGPWRGQAHVALVDTVLEQLDLKSATEHAMAAGNLLAKGLDKEAEPSWKEATYDIYLRQGIVSLVDGRFDAAVQGFEQAKQSAPKETPKEVQTGLDRLIEAAQNRAKLVPDELAVGDDRAATALALGNICNVLRRYDEAKVFFTLPLTGPTRSHSAAHRSFAGLGLARAVIGSGKTVPSSKSSPQSSPQLQAKAICEASLQEYSKGSWHDETLYRLATLIQDMAEAKFGIPPKPAADAKQAEPPARVPNPQEREAQVKAERERRAALVKAKAEALPYWQDIIKRFPQSPRSEQASYNAGVLLYEMAEVAPAEASEQSWREAGATLHRFTKQYPQSPYGGDAYVRQIDIALERIFDPKMALAVSAAAGEWAKWAIGAPPLDAPKQSAWALVVKYPDKAEIRRSVYDCLLRLGLVAYLAADFDKAAEWIDIAGPKPPAASFTANPDMESLTLYYLQKAIRSKKPVTEKRALDTAKTDQQRLLVQLGDLYLETVRPDKAEKVFLRIIDRDPSLGKVSPGLEGYAMLQMATSLDRQSGRRAEALECLKKLVTRRDLQGTYWAGLGEFRLALFTYNQTQDPKQSLPLYEAMLNKFPDHEMAELAHLYYCLDAIELKNTALANKASQGFFAKYPKSEYRSLLEQRMDAIAEREGNNTSP